MYDYDLLIIMRIAEVLMDEESPEKVRELRLKALGGLRGQLEHYKKLGYIDRLLNGIAEKRVAMIMKATTKTEMDRIMTPKAPHYNGAEFVTVKAIVDKKTRGMLKKYDTMLPEEEEY